MSSDLAISVSGLGKMYRIYQCPEDRLKQMLFGRWRVKSYGAEFWALRNISFSVKKGEMFGIIGRNGAGKSTLLQVLTGTLMASEGTYKVEGRVAALLELGSGFSPEFTGRENIFLYGAVLGFTRAQLEDRYEEIVAFADIGQFIDQSVKTYSTGMVMRLAFAVTSTLDPDVLIIDEALAVGDISFQRKCFQRFEDLRARGVTVLYVGHGLDSVTQFCQRAALIDHGRLLMVDDPRTVVHEYKRVIAEEVAAGLALAPTTTTATATTAAPMLKTHFKREPACQEFGSGQAEIIDFGVLDVERHPTAIIGDEAVVTFVNEVRFCASVADPILTFTVRDVKGNEITGTNTMFAQRSIGPRVAGDTVRVEFTQPLSLKNGHYSVSFSCTEFVDSGLVVHHRLYDVIMVQSITTRRFVGIFDPLSRITIAHS